MRQLSAVLFVFGASCCTGLFGQTQVGSAPIWYNGSNVGIGTGANNAPLYSIDLNNPSSSSQIHISPGGQDSGGYLTSVLPSDLTLSAGASWNGSNWLAKASAANILAAFLGTLYFYADTGLTAGSAYSPSPRMTITSSGNVGIGTTSPQHTLGVNGSIGAQSITVASTGADYVFDPKYKLESLFSVADYIKQNHHLPAIPSAAEMKEKGVDLGEMQTKLLAKIEELTLHMIDLEKENQELKSQIQDINERTRR